MPRTCMNCGTAITCGCQDRKAKDGAPCCSKCVDNYNTNLDNAIQPSLDYNAVTVPEKKCAAPEIKSIGVKYNNYDK